MKDGITVSRWLLLLAELGAAAVLAVVSTSHFGTADGLRITAAYLVAYLLPLFLLKRSRGSSNAAHAVLLLIAIFICTVAYDSLVTWTSIDGYSLQRPNVIGDARSYYKWAILDYEGSAEYNPGMFPGFPLMMVALWKLLGMSVIWPQAMNMMFTLASVVFTGMLTRRLLGPRTSLAPRTLQLGAMLLMCLLPYYLVSGVTILKEAGTFLAFAMGGYALSSMAASDEERHNLWRDLLILVLACALLAFIRPTFLYFMAVGVVVMALPQWRRDWLMSLFMLLVIALFMALGDYLASYSLNRQIEIVDGGWNMQRTFNNHYNQSIVGFYFLYSPLHRLALLPMTMGVQFVLPFPVPWMPPYNDEPFLLCYFSRMTYGWYLFGGTALFYCLFMSWRRHENIGVWAWWPVIVYVGLAYVMAGTMARYMLPFQPLMVPMVLFVLYRLCQGHWRRAYAVWIITLLVVLMAALIYYHHFR